MKTYEKYENNFEILSILGNIFYISHKIVFLATLLEQTSLSGLKDQIWSIGL